MLSVPVIYNLCGHDTCSVEGAIGGRSVAIEHLNDNTVFMKQTGLVAGTTAACSIFITWRTWQCNTPSYTVLALTTATPSRLEGRSMQGIIGAGARNV